MHHYLRIVEELLVFLHVLDERLFRGYSLGDILEDSDHATVVG